MPRSSKRPSACSLIADSPLLIGGRRCRRRPGQGHHLPLLFHQRRPVLRRGPQAVLPNLEAAAALTPDASGADILRAIAERFLLLLGHRPDCDPQVGTGRVGQCPIPCPPSLRRPDCDRQSGIRRNSINCPTGSGCWLASCNGSNSAVMHIPWHDTFPVAGSNALHLVA